MHPRGAYRRDTSAAEAPLCHPAVGPEEPLCSVAKQLGWVPQGAGKAGQPTSQPVLTLTGQGVQRAGQLVTFHMPTQPVGTKLPSPCSPEGRCLQSSFWSEQRCPETNKQPIASCSCCAAAKTSSEGIKGKEESRLLPEKLLKLKESEGFLKRSNLLRCSHCQTVGEPPFWGQRRASRYLLTLPETQLPHVGTL